MSTSFPQHNNIVCIILGIIPLSHVVNNKVWRMAVGTQNQKTCGKKTCAKAVKAGIFQAFYTKHCIVSEAKKL